MNRKTTVRKVLGRTCSLIALGAMTVALTPTPATAGTTTKTYDFSYESGFEGWVPKTDETSGAPDCDGPHDSAIVRSAAKARTGTHSLDFKVRSPHDCGLAYVDRQFDVGTTNPVRLDLSLWLWSEDYEGGTGGLFAVLARGGADCVSDPRWNRGGGGWEGFTELGSTGHAEGPGWYNYRYRATVTPNPSGHICVSQAMKLSSTTGEDFKHYYLDDTKVTIN
ncbi:hypothetical protein [Amycolatopsis anabasis]|uniref:hypothetical protein n=1 Tax=Amycolatopsis anabasis TaxID=1840409 RepID=UPI00131C0A77|nr:hypothetical protein [Amycolatopsis anabasis]